MTLPKVIAHLATCGAIALALPACGSQVDDADIVAEELEIENGGLDMEDEAPLFGDAELFAAANLEGEEVVVADPMAAEAEVIAMQNDINAVIFDATVMWGQLPFNPEAETPHNWSGQLRINRGALIVRRALAFEGVTDRITPRTSPQSVEFRSATLPHADGMRLTLVDPDPTAEEPLILTYEGLDGTTFTTPVRDIVANPVNMDVDDEGNRIVALAFARPADACSYGFLRGRWHKLAEDRGILLGRVASADGELLGHMRGVYGRRLNGDRVFFGKYINRDGQFRGIFAGTYRNGHFGGLWLHRAGEAGLLGGEYRETIPGPEIGGHFAGRWAERTCNIQLAPMN